MRLTWIVAMGFLAALSACAPQAAKKDDTAAASTCRDDGPRFPGTDICLINVSNYLDPARLENALTLSPKAEADGCMWSYNQTMMGDGTEALLYRALSCKGVTTALEFGGGARSASLTLKNSAMGFPAGEEVVRIFTSDPADPQFNIRSMIDGLPAAEKAKCAVQPANVEGFPKDALVIGYKAPYAAKLKKDEVDAVCGEYGLDEGSQRYWLVRDGYAFFFNLGQEELDWDPSSLTVIRKGADGSWAAAK